MRPCLLVFAVVWLLTACATSIRPESAGASAQPSQPSASVPTSLPSATPPARTQTPTPVPSPVTGVETHPLVDPHGEYAFATRDGLGVQGPAVSELWAIPLAGGGQPQLVVRHTGYGVPYLTNAISPDGRRFAFAEDRGDGVSRIAIASIVDGSVSWLRSDDTAVDDVRPIWDPTGRRIAFVRATRSNMASLWIVNVDGSGLRQLTQPAIGQMYAHTWTPDGNSIAFYQGIGYDVLNVSTGARDHADDIVSAVASWRVAAQACWRWSAIARAPGPSQRSS